MRRCAGYLPTSLRRARPDQRLDASGAAIVSNLGIAILLMAVGFLPVGIAAMLARLWRDRRRFTPMGNLDDSA
jgi:hypothetical protein